MSTKMLFKVASKIAQQLEEFEDEPIQTTSNISNLASVFENIYRQPEYISYVQDNNYFEKDGAYVLTLDITSEPDYRFSDSDTLSSFQFYDLVKSLVIKLRATFTNGKVSVKESEFELSGQSKMAREIVVTIPILF